ncbi:MAG: cytochrome c3 family protein, partial [Planctomycetales bacterium]|nr:cytochrome c3 family protein [Planctomycetales bacterium]
YAPTAAMGLAEVAGNMKRLKDDFDPKSEEAEGKLPQVKYEPTRFRADGKVFFDLVRKPESNSCLYCHSNIATDNVTGGRWLHDEDVHVRAGISCADCHRNGLDHATVRGFDDEQHVAGNSIASFSCAGCHVGSQDLAKNLTGRLGAPRPEHRGIPPLHFDKLTCTACHSGPQPTRQAGKLMNSILHTLGHKSIRDGEELPGVFGPVVMPAQVIDGNQDGSADHEPMSGKYAPHRMMWPSYWGILKAGDITVLHPDAAYELVRRDLKVRTDFTPELADVKLSLLQRKELLGEERSRVKEFEWTDEEREKILKAESKVRVVQVAERMAKALAAIEKAYPDTQAVYVSGGIGFVRSGEAEIKPLLGKEVGNRAGPVAWTIGHNVRPARQALGAQGCRECHSHDSPFFNTEVTAAAVLPDQPVSTWAVADVQPMDRVVLSSWNELFVGRDMFKIAGLIVLGLTSLLTFASVVSRMTRH